MNPRTLILVVVALVFAGVAAILARNLIGGQQAAPVAQAAVGPKILVASTDLPIGKLIDIPDLRWQAWPDENVSEAYMRDTVATVDQLVGHVVRDGIGVGEPITRGKVVAPGERGFMAAVLAPDMRAITIAINRTSGIAGLIFPGDRVDLILNHSVVDDSNISRQVGETVFRNIRILAIDAVAVQSAPFLGKSVTLEVTPKLAEEIIVVQRMGTLSLVLRSLRSADGTDMTRDEGMPDSGKSTYSWDAEVSDLAPPLDINQNKHPILISRGGNTEVIVFKKDEQ